MNSLKLSFQTCPAEILCKIASELEHDQPLGPPSAHLSLLTTCKHIYNALRQSSTFLSGLFRDRFDITAARRRYGPRVTKSDNLIQQLKRNIDTLRAFRHNRAEDFADEAVLTGHLWQVFLLLMEDDGKNRAQVDWAGVPNFVNDYVDQRDWSGPEGWPLDTTIPTLVMWILWMTADTARVNAWTMAHRTRLLDLTRPFVMMSMRYPAFHLPDNHWVVPIDSHMEGHFPLSMQSAHGDWPLYRDAVEITHQVPTYGGSVLLTRPLMSTAARLIFVAIRELVPLGVPEDLFRDRAHLVSYGLGHRIMPTKVDIHEVNNATHARLRAVHDWDWLANLAAADRHRELSGNLLGSRAPSAQWDHDFERLMYCNDPFNVHPAKEKIHPFGTIEGHWAGRMNIPTEEHYTALTESGHMPPEFGDMLPFATTGPLFLTLKEFVCVSPQEPAPLGFQRNVADDGINNGWYPEGTSFQSVPGGLHVMTPKSHIAPKGHIARYEQYRVDRPTSHDSGSCGGCDISMEEPVMPKSASVPASMPAGELTEDERDTLPRERPFVGGGYTDARDPTVKRPRTECDGVTDVVLTGTTEHRHAMAWHDYKFHGRVRHWDGLISIVREPVNHEQGRFILRGYIVGGDTFVGTWRIWNEDGFTMPWEGTVVLSRV